METIRVAMAQINSTVGDLSGNSRKIIDYTEQARQGYADIVVFPELAVTGYPPEDLLLKPQFIKDNITTLKEISRNVSDIVAIVGFVDRKGSAIYNAAAVLHKKKIAGVYRKMLLPNYGVFDEKRYFRQGETVPVFQYGNILFGVSICEDIWSEEGPTTSQSHAGASLIININASPYYLKKIRTRERIASQRAKENRVPIVYTNLVGGQDELVFDGQSFIADDRGKIISRASAFREDLLFSDIPVTSNALSAENNDTVKRTAIVALTGRIPEREKKPLTLRKTPYLNPAREVYEALSLGLRDYTGKNGFTKAVIGLSGGVDSALVATLAVDVLGKENVVGISMPSRYTSRESMEDAEQLARNLGVALHTIPIDHIFTTYTETMAPIFSGHNEDITEENLQARIRGNILMALSNKFGWIVLTTGNKSETSVGYSTLYGDTAGGFAAIKDVPKTLVYSLCKYRNSLDSVIPVRILTKQPTAELRPNQKDTDSLPPYETLDPVLKAYVEEDRGIRTIAHKEQDIKTVQRIIRLVDSGEYKRRQSPPGIKITPKAFGKDRRMPITNRYRG